MIPAFCELTATCCRHPLIRAMALVTVLSSGWGGLANPAQAQNLLQWTAFNSFYDIGSNWTPLGPPTSIDAAQFLQNATYEVRWDGVTASLTPDVGFVDVGNGQVTFQNQTSTQHSFTINEDLTLFGGGSLANSGLNLNVGGSTRIIGNSLLVIDGTDPAGSQFNASGPVLVAEGSLTFSGGATGSLDTVQVNVDSNGPANMSVLGGSLVSASQVSIGNGGSQPAGSSGSLIIDGLGSRLTIGSAGSLTVGNSAGLGSHELTISNGGLLQSSFSDITIGKSGIVNVTSGEMNGSVNDIYLNGIVRAESGGVVNVRETFIGSSSSSSGLLTVHGQDSQWNSGFGIDVGEVGAGTINIEAGATVNARDFAVGLGSNATGTATVTGPGSQLHVSNTLNTGTFGTGTLNIEAGGLVVSDNSAISAGGGSTGTVRVSGADSQWNSGGLKVGGVGDGILEISDGGVVNSGNSILAFRDFGSFVSSAVVNVTGAGSAWNVSGFLRVGDEAQASMDIQSDALVTVTGSTSINSLSAVNLSGGRFEFGTSSYDSFTRINATGGSLAGAVNVSGVNDLASLGALQNPATVLTDVAARNSGLLHGSAILSSALDNQSIGELRTLTGQWARFEGAGNTNSGEINNFGGLVDFGKDMTNTSSGFIGGRGQFVADGGWTNEGVMAFSGTTDILGDVINNGGGQIVTSGGTTTTFFDDVLHNGTEIRTSAGSSTVIFGEASGAGAYTGAGTVFFEGDLRPGNSPDIVSFEGDVVMGTGAHSFFELAGTDGGLFDQMLVAGDLFLDGTLSVDLIDGFLLGASQQFVIADVGGQLSGQFAGLGEGDLVGNFGGRDLFISYAAGSGQGVTLFSAVPEPGTASLLGLACMGLLLQSRRRRE